PVGCRATFQRGLYQPFAARTNSRALPSLVKWPFTLRRRAVADAVPEGPFAKVETSNVDFPALERSILAFWDAHGIFEKRKALNAGKPRWSFLDGPITANNPMGVHHAWGRTYKDAYNR